MGWVFLAVLLLIALLLFNFRRHQLRGNYQTAGLNVAAAALLSVVDAVIAQFV